MTYVKRRWKVEHSWTCSACKAQNRGRDLTCSKCGKGKSDENYDERNATSLPAVTDPTLIAIANGGPNWDCTYCRFENRSGALTCAQCGADKIASTARTLNDARGSQGLGPLPETRPSNAVYPEKPESEPKIPRIIVPSEPPPEPEKHTAEKNFWEEFADKRTPTTATSGYRDAPVKRADEDHREHEDELPRPRNNETLRLVIVALAVLGASALAIGFFTWLFMPWHERVHVASATWARRCELQHRETHHDHDWGSPPGAFNVSCVSRQHGTHSCNPYNCNAHSVDCHCHQVANGESCHESCTSGQNGFSDCEEVCETEYTTECDTCTEYDTCYEQCPTYDDWCRYSYYDWPVVATTLAGGTDRNRGDRNAGRHLDDGIKGIHSFQVGPGKGHTDDR